MEIIYKIDSVKWRKEAGGKLVHEAVLSPIDPTQPIAPKCNGSIIRRGHVPFDPSYQVGKTVIITVSDEAYSIYNRDKEKRDETHI